VPLPNPIPEPSEELESLISGIAPIAPSILPGTAAVQPLYQTGVPGGNAEPLDLIEPSSLPPIEFGATATDDFIINKAATTSINSTSSPAAKANSNPTDPATSLVDPLIGSNAAQTGETADPLTNPGPAVENSASQAASPVSDAPDKSDTEITASDALNNQTTASSAPDASNSNAASQTTTQSSAVGSKTSVIPVEFSGGTFTVKEVPGQESFVGIEFLADGGLYQGELAIFNLEGMDKFAPGSPEFIQEAARRALSNSYEGYVVMDDATEGARLPSYLPEGDFNSGEYRGVKTFAMKPGTEFGFMLVPNGTVKFARDYPNFGGDKQPLFSMVTASDGDTFRLGQIADVNGDGSTFVIEDMGVVLGADGDYNDVIFRVTGAASNNIPGIGEVIAAGKDWRDTAWGKNLIDAIADKPQSQKSIATNPSAPADEKTEAVGSSESSPTPLSSPAVAGSNPTEPTAIETTVVGEKEATPTVSAAEDTDNSQTPTENAVAAVAEPETRSTATAAVTSEKPSPAAAESSIVGVASEEKPGDGKTTVINAIKSDLPQSEPGTIEHAKKEPLTTETNIEPEASNASSSTIDAVDRPTLKTETTVTDAANYPTASASTIVTEVALQEPLKPETTVTGAGTPFATETDNADAAAPSGELTVVRADRSNGLIFVTATQEATTSGTATAPTDTATAATAPATTDASAGLAETDTEPVTISNSLPGITDAAPAAIGNNLSGEITDATPAAIGDNLSGEITDTDSPAIPAPTGPIESDAEPATISNSLSGITDTEPDPIPKESGEITDTEPATIPNSLSGITDTEPDRIPNSLSGKITDTEPDTNSAIVADGEPPADTFALAESDNSDSQPSFANLSIAVSSIPTNPGTFTVGSSGTVRFDYTFDGGYYEGELAIFSLTGMEAFTPGTPSFAAEALRRALTNSTEGRIVIRDSIEGAKFIGAMPGESDFGAGPYQGIKSFTMTPGDTFGVLLVPNGTVQLAYQHPWLGDIFPEHRPLFSIPSANPSNTSYVLPIADATGTGNTFALEDTTAATSDGDFNDVIFTVLGATGNAPPIGQLINPLKEWRNTPLGEQIIDYANSLVEEPEPNPDTIWLTEGTAFANKIDRDFTVPASASTLNIGIVGLSFDTSDANPKSINDALEISLVDANGKPLTGTIGSGKNALFNITEGNAPQLAPGVTFIGSTISIDLSQIPPGTATLQVRLVNNDSDTATRVGIATIAVVPGAAPPPEPTTPTGTVPDTTPIDFAALTDVSGSVETDYKQTSFNSTTKVLHTDLALKNIGQQPLRDRLLVGVTNISDPTVKLLDASGITPEGIVYYDYTKLVGDGILKAGEVTQTGTLKFHNPDGVQFSYDLVFLGESNKPPEFSGTPDTEVVIGKPYVYTATATDPEGDAIVYSLLEKPLLMEIDSQTGSIAWNPTASDLIGNHSVTVQADDGNGGITKLTYTLSAVNQPPNRPPVFVSTPIVDAAVNTPYRYDSDATDPDSDTLTYNLVLGPEGMTVNPDTGLVQWTPPAARVFGDTVLGRISAPGERDTYTFSALEGQRVYYDALRGSGNQTLKLYSPSGLLVLDSTTSPIDTSYPRPPVNLTETGNYRLTIGGEPGDYGFSLIDMEETPVAPFDKNIIGLLSPGSEDDAYRFTGFKGQRLYFDQLSGSSTSADWILYDGEGRRVSSWVDGKNVGSWGTAWQDNEIVLPSDGEYTLILRGSAPFFGSTSYTWRIVTPDTITYPLQLGNNANPNTVSAAITEKGERDIYTFEGTKGQRLYFDYLSSSNQVNAWVKLVSPSGAIVPVLNSIGLGSDTEPFTIDETGTYRLEVDGQWESTGNYSFNLLDVGQATPINLDADVTGQLSPGFETHLYSFTGDANQRLYLDSDSTLGWANWTLYGPGNQRITVDSETTFGGANTSAGTNPQSIGSDFEVVLPSNGGYLLAVQGRNTTPVDYRFRVITPQTQSGGTLIPDAGGNFSVSGSISERGERDVYTFTGSANQRLILDSLAQTPGTYVRAVSPSGIEVFNIQASGDSGRLTPYILPEAGNYRLIVDGNVESTENYNFRLLSLTTAPTLNLNAPTSGTLSPGSETDIYQFTGTEGDRLYLDTLLSSSPGGWLLYGPGNQLVSSNYLWSDIETVLPGSGTYYIVLRGDGTPAAGGNGIAAPINYSIQPFFSTANPTPLTLGSVNNASISKPGEQDVYTFTGSVGQRMYFDPRSGNGNITAKIISPSGLEIFSGNTGADGLSNTLTESGTYRLTIDGNNDVLGSYSFRLADATAAPILPLGTATPGSLLPNEAVMYQISGTAGARIRFDSSSPTASGASWALYAPGFPNFLSRVDGSSLNNDFEVLLPVTGTYTLALQNSSGSNVSYNIEANDITPSAVTNSGLGVARTGTVSAPTPVNHTFTASAGTLVYFDAFDVDSDAVSVTLLNPSGSTVSALNGSNASWDSSVPIQLQQTGTYTLRVQGTGDYGYSLLDLAASPTLSLNATASIPSIQAWGTTAYKFDGAVGQKLYYDGLTNNPGVSLKLISPSGRQIDTFTAAEYWTNYATDRLNTLTESGTHYLLVSNEQATASTNISFRLLDRTSAATLNPDAVVEGTFAPNTFETDLYRFNGQAGQYLYFDALNASPSNTWSLYGPGGQVLGNRTSGANDFELALPGDGEYLLALQGYGGSPASYRFQVVTPTFPPVPMTVGTTVSGTIGEPGEKDTYTFNGTAGQRLYFDGISDSGYKGVRLLSPSGVEVFPNTWANGNRDLFALLESGIYRVEVDVATVPSAPEANKTGPYSFRFLDAEAATPIALDAPAQTWTVPANETRLLQFTGSTGQNVYFLNDGSNWTLYGPGNSILKTNWPSDAELTLPADGTYTAALINPHNSSVNYSFQAVTSDRTITPISVGNAVTGSIAKMGELDTYTFSGAVGQQLVVDALAADSSLWMKIFSPSGKGIYGHETQGQQMSLEREPITLQEAGIYRVEIDGSSRGTGNYSFRLLDTAATNHPSVFDLPFDQNISGTLPNARERQVYRFEGTQGQHLYFDLAGSWNASNGTKWELYGPGNQKVGSLSGVPAPDLEVELPGDGTYTLVVGGNTNVTAPENYQFRVVTPETNVFPLTLGAPVTSSISEPGERDTYKFTGRPGQRVFFDRALGNTNITAKLFSPSLPTDTVLNDPNSGSINDSWSGVVPVWSGSLNADTNAPIFLEEAGEYHLVIDGSDNATGNYGFRLVDVEDPQAVPLLNLDTDISNTLSPGTEIDFYQFKPAVGQPLYFDLAASTGSDVRWVLYGPDNKPVPASGWTNSDFEITPTINGTYILALQNNSPTPANYSFKVATPPVPTPTALSLGSTVSGSIGEPGERKEYTFAGTPGGRVYFDSLGASNNIRFKLVSPSGAEFGSNTWNAANPATYWNPTDTDSAPTTLTESGTYRLIVDGSDSATGSYTFRLQDVGAAATLAVGTPTPGTLDPGNETELYKFTGTAGQTLNFDVATPFGSSADWILYGPNDRSLPNTSGTTNSDFSSTLPASGEYVLAVRGRSANPVSYSFTATDATPAPVATTGLGTVQNGNIAPGQVVNHTFTANAGTRIYFDSQDVDNDAVNVKLLAPNGTQVFLINASSDWNSPFIQLQQTGTYTVEVRGSNPSSTGDYRYQILELPSVTPDPRDSENSIQMGVTVSKTLEPGRRAEVYSFTGTPGQAIFFDGLIPTGGAELVNARLVSPSGDTIFFNDGWWRPRSAGDAGPYTLTEAGTYNLLVTGEQDAPADFRFRVLDVADAAELELNQRTSATLEPGNPIHLYKFSGSADQRIFFDSLTGSNANWVLYQPGHHSGDATRIVTGFEWGGINTDRDVVLPVDGEYVLAVFGNNSNTPAAYSFQALSGKAMPAVVTPGDGETSGAVGEELGAYRVVLETSDGNGGTAQQDFLLRVGPEPGNSSPSFNTPPVTGGYTSARYIYRASAADADGDTLTYLLEDGPSGMVIESETGRVIWATPSAGTHKVSVRVEDGRGGVDTQSFDINISSAVPGTVKGSVYLDADGTGDRRVTNPGNMTPDSRVTVGDRFADNYAAYDLGRPGGVPGILGAMTFKRNPDGTVDPNTLLLGGGAASPGGALYEVKVVRGENGHIIGLDDDGEAETPYTATYFADSPYSDAGLVYTPDGVLLANLWKPTGIYSIKPGGAPSGGYPRAMGGLTFVPEGFPGEGQLKATGAYPNNGFYTLTYTPNGTFPDGTPRYTINPPELETVAGFGPGAFVYMPLTAPNFDGGEGLLMAEWNAAGIYAYDLDSDGNPIPTTRTPFITGYGGAWGAVTDPVTGDSLFNAWAGFSNLMVVRGLGRPTDNEPGMENWLVYVDLDRDGVQDSNEPFTYTDASGNYSFTLAPGNYRIVSQLQPGWTQTDPTNPVYREVTVTSNDTEFGVDFAATNSRLAGPNLDPEFTSTPPVTVKAGERLVYRATATDLNDDNLTFELVVAPKGMAIAPNGTISWRPPLGSVGTHDVIARVSDGRGGIDLQAFKIEVTPGNTPPAFISQLPENVSPGVGQPFQYQAKAFDLDGDAITYSIVTNNTRNVTPPNATIDPATGVVNWTPTAAQQGGAFNWAYAGEVEPWEILIKATDNKGGEAFQRLSLVVTPPAPNRAPAITSTPRTNTRLDKTYFYQVEATDPDGNPLTYSLINPPAGMAFATPATTPAGQTFSEGLITWTPGVSQQGTHPITVRVSDSRGGFATQTFNLTADNIAGNRPPSIDSTPEQLTNLGRLYEYNLTGSDADGDRLLWSLDRAPAGAILDPQSGALRWQPTAEQIGEHTISIRTIDGNGGFAVQEFTLIVRGINTPPAIVSQPPTKAATGQTYSYAVAAKDLENDPLTFSLVNHPAGMAIDSNGVIQWTPNTSQLGQHSVEVAVTDKQGAIATQTFTVTAGTDAINLPPTITSTPAFTASPGRPYSYQVTATDADGTIAQYQLLQSPGGMTINSNTGVITWNNPTAGNHQVVVGALDNSGTGAAQGFTLIARENAAAVIPQIPPQSASPGQSYRYNLRATDANGDLLTFTLVQSPPGMTVDEFGRISWQPTAANIGNNPVEVRVTDAFGESVTVSYNLSVVADTVAPKVNLIASSNAANVGESVTFTVNAVDNVKVESLGLTINGTPVVLDAQGKATVKLNNLTPIAAVATAKDSAGNVGNATASVSAIDPTDVNAPTLTINLESDVEITAPVNIIGTIADSNLAYYTLEIAPVGSTQFKEVSRGTNPVTNGTVATFDPTVLANGAYTLRFTAFDANGNGSTTERTVNVAGDLKLGNFRLSFTDLSVPVAGIPINITRTYDSLNANNSDDFGYGWRMEFRDTDLKTSLKPDPTYEELGVNTVAFDGKTKVFITLPGGKRETFTFKPQSHHLNQYLGAAGPGAAMYKPAFESQKGSTMTLTVKDANLVRTENGEYYGVNGQPFNPENPAFGGIYILTTKEGLVYEIDAKTGDLLTATDSNGNKLTFSDAGIASSTGKSVTFERDSQGRIVSVTDPAGEKVRYEYDAKGDLVAVQDRETNRTQFKYEDADRPHFLTEVIDPLGRSGVKTEYDDQGRLKQMLDANGSAVELIYDPNNSLQKVKDVFGKETTYVYDNRGNVLTEIDPLGKRIDRTYDADNNVLTETVITTELNAAGNPVEVRSKTEWTYDSRGNKLTEKDPLGNVSRWTYNSRGQVLTETDALGNTATYTYSPSGNLLTTKDAKGNATTYNYDARGNLLKLTDATNNSTNFTYNAAGDVTNLADANGNKAAYIYDSNGNMKRETMTVQTPTGEKVFVTEWTYNDEGQIKSITQEGRTVTYEYEAGRQSASIENNRRTEYRYNSQGKLVETIYPDDTPATNSDNSRTVTVYDKGGRQRATIDRDGRVTHYKYDDAGQLIETIYPDESPNQIQQLLNAISPGTTPQTVDWTNIVYPDITPVYLANNSRTKTEYYKNGQVKAEIDVDGNRTEYQYDAANRVTLTRFDANNYITYTYDAVGNRKTETVFAEGTSTTTVYNSQGLVTAITDPNGKTTGFEYDEKGQLKAVVDAAQKRTEYTYDSAGNLKTVKDALGQVTTYEYDDKGRRKAVIRPDTKRSSIVYDDAQKTVTITDFNNKTVKYTYNDQNQVVSKQYQNASGATVSVTYTANGLEETITDSRGATVYKYDNLGQLISRKDPTGPYLASGNSIEYKYESGQVSEVKTPTRTTTYTYEEGRLKTVSTPDLGTVTYVYYPDGNLWKTFYTNNLLETRTYDERGRLDVVKTASIDPVTQQELQVISSFDYLVDGVGNRKEVLEQSGRKVEYKYDDLHRLLEEKVTNDPGGNNRVVTYTYDAVGNRLSKTDSVSGVTTYTYNSLNQLDFLTDNNVFTDYTYDDNGNLISEVTGNNSTVYRWVNDGENRLVGVTVSEGGVTRNVVYQYNAQGVRVGKVVDGVETRYLIDELQPYSQVVEEYDAAGNVKGSYVYGLDLLGRVSGMQREFYHSDGLGSARLLTNGTGAVTDTYSYDAYGNLIAGNGGANNPYLFAGEQRDGETGLDYLRARYYDPTLGRFVSADAYEGTLDDPMSLHDYQYAHANPVVNTDPSGYMTNMTELLGNMAAYSVLAGLSYTTGSAVGTVAGGGSVWDAVALYDQFFAGLTDALTFGISSQTRRLIYGETATQNHRGLYFNLGRLGGAVASAAIGAFSATFATFNSAPWWARAALGYDLFGAGLGMVQSTINAMEGRATWWDALAFLPLIAGISSKVLDDIPGGALEPGNPRSTSFPRLGNRLLLNQADVVDYGRVACGPTSCAMILDTLGLPYDLNKLVIQTRVPRNKGAFSNDLSMTLRRNGATAARAVQRQSIDDLKRATSQGHPAIVLVDLEQLSGDPRPHFVVVDGITTRQGQEVVAIRDPAGGRQYFTPVEEFSQRFISKRSNGFAIYTNPKN
jgi:RHS repeat-associated protein